MRRGARNAFPLQSSLGQSCILRLSTGGLGITDLDTLLRLAEDLARRDPDFAKRKGPGLGDLHTDDFMTELETKATEALGDGCLPDASVIDEAGYTFDYYLPREATVVEFGFSLRNPRSEFERDLFKALLAKKARTDIRRLVLVGKPGTKDRLNARGPQAIMDFVRREFGIDTEVREIGGGLARMNHRPPRHRAGSR